MRMRVKFEAYFSRKTMLADKNNFGSIFVGLVFVAKHSYYWRRKIVFAITEIDVRTLTVYYVEFCSMACGYVCV